MRLTYLLCLMGGVLSAEPSAFDLQSGATKQELGALKSSNKNLQGIITTLKGQTDALLQSQEGLKSVFEGQGVKLKEVSDALNTHDQTLKALKSTQDMQGNLLKEQSSLIDALKSQVEANKKALTQLDQKLNDMNGVLTQMNSDFATKLQAIQTSIEEQARLNAKKLKEIARLASTTPKNATPLLPLQEVTFDKNPAKRQAIAKEALDLYHQKHFQEAQARFAWLGETHYKPAYHYYMAGESAYMQKNYKDAISFYKKSALIKDKTNYMPVLLWHTAWAFKFLGDQNNHYKFLRSLSRLYPESDQGKRALNALDKETNTKKDTHGNASKSTGSNH
ncbi:tetratricopeptide repeat protein [Helicobacter vulpis]|uniref:tetratricopeptide repeat protein n=1 Tax=Helicobacter vulpis TaxID=2316076 RepID=UPI000EB4AB81|nr:hypothetical protein [Helicobacter vulpis]